MGTLEKLGRWFEPPVVERAVYRCLECESELGRNEPSCSECGGEVTEATEPVEYIYWGPYH
ncbi:hypothetical protein SAMN05216559_0216 [Halomicrobium zhouii]|uniref:Uncharacterized protein n=1 Tax=Halomicrobium zhouii TaxID=767519 RepID=A0A1I6K5K0_9EURY|nr:hypothetical protein [Halomicrobium zhouii]SFR86414.1 hypothetical protein SAMN05216559_0216 [Halomicrobium zhouii]